MKTLTATVVSVHASTRDDLGKDRHRTITAELDGFVGDQHRGYTRRCWSADKQSKDTLRRNERQWSAIALEELAQISRDMDLTENVSAECVGANICLEGIEHLSRLPKGTLLKFPSGAVLVVEEYNPPCLDMGRKIARLYQSRSGRPVVDTAFSKAAKLSRGLLGVVDAAGDINEGDEASIVVYEHPSWLSAD